MPTKVHFFIIQEAVLYGIERAVILSNIRFWLEKNKANNKHFYDCYYWTYNSGEAFAKLLPYIQRRTITNHLSFLCEKGVLLSGNYNVAKYDRTFWYTIPTEFGDEQDSVNGLAKNSKPLANFSHAQENFSHAQENFSHAQEEFSHLYQIINTDNKQQIINTDIKERGDFKKSRARFEPPTVDEVRNYCQEKGYTFNPESFVAHYDSNGWMVGKNKMKSWQSACVTWQNRDHGFTPAPKPKSNPKKSDGLTYDENGNLIFNYKPSGMLDVPDLVACPNPYSHLVRGDDGK